VFTRYIKQILVKLVCSLAVKLVEVGLMYADDIVLLAPAWRKMQRLLDIFSGEACMSNME